MTTTFHGLDLLTAPGRVFTPRPATEALVDAALVAIYTPGDGLGPLRSLISLCAGGKLAMPGFVLVQHHRDVLEADCRHLPELRERLEERVPAVS